MPDLRVPLAVGHGVPRLGSRVGGALPWVRCGAAAGCPGWPRCPDWPSCPIGRAAGWPLLPLLAIAAIDRSCSRARSAACRRAPQGTPLMSRNPGGRPRLAVAVAEAKSDDVASHWSRRSRSLGAPGAGAGRALRRGAVHHGGGPGHWSARPRRWLRCRAPHRRRARGPGRPW